MKYRAITFVLTALMMLLPGPVLAFNQAQQHRILYGAQYYDPDQIFNGNGGSGGCISPLYPAVTDAGGFANAINQYIQKYGPGSAFIGTGNLFVAAGQKYGVNPAWVVNIARKESSFGAAVPAGSFNAFGRTAAAGQPSVQAAGRAWYKYESFPASIDPQTQYLKQVYIDQGLTDFTAITTKYAPPSENDTKTYIAQMEDWVGQVMNLAGSSVDCTSGGSAGTGNNAIVTIAKQELALHLVGTGSLQNGGPVCKYQGPPSNPCEDTGGPSSQGEAWCADFVSWVYNQANVPFHPGDLDGWRVPGAARIGDLLKTQGYWYDNTPSAPRPVPGNAVYFPGGEGHVGIIIAVNGNTITTIEGNAGPTVAQFTHALSGSSSDVGGWGGMK